MRAKRKVLAIWSRKLHRWGTVAVAVPLLIVLVTGTLLLWKKQVAWIQPPEQRSEAPGSPPRVSLDDILRAARSADAAGISTWDDVDKLDVQPRKGIVKVQAREGGWEVQIDLATGGVLHVAKRRSDLIEALHDGSWFHDHVKLWVFFPAALVLLGLYLTGLYLFYLPYKTKWARADRRKMP